MSEAPCNSSSICYETAIEAARVIRIDPGHRGIESFFSKVPERTLYDAAMALCRSRSVLLVTGFYIPTGNPPAAETDGPPGISILAKALVKKGIKTTISTELHNYDILKNTVESLLTKGEIDSLIRFVPIDDKTTTQPKELTDLHDYDVILSCEKPGPSEDGIPRSMRGVDLSKYVNKIYTDIWVKCYHEKDYPILISIGDGGNELGMGNACDTVKGGDFNINCVIPCHIPILSGVSNWGAIALAALIWNNDDIEEFGVEMYNKAVLAAYDAGSIDGVFLKHAPPPFHTSVDGLVNDNEEVVLSLLKLIKK